MPGTYQRAASPAGIRIPDDDDEKVFTTYSNYLANTAEQVDDDEPVLAGGDRALLAACARLGIASADINALA